MMAFNAKKLIDEQVQAIKDEVGDKKAVIALSGGVDSAVAALLTHKAIGDNLVSIAGDNDPKLFAP